jgi:hypothetical protein
VLTLRPPEARLSAGSLTDALVAPSCGWERRLGPGAARDATGASASTFSGVLKVATAAQEREEFAAYKVTHPTSSKIGI